MLKKRSFHAEIVFLWLVTPSKTSVPASVLHTVLLLSVEIPATTRPCAELELLAPVHKHSFRRGLVHAGFRDTGDSLLSHPTGLCRKGCKYSEPPLTMHGQYPIKPSSAKRYSADDSSQSAEVTSEANEHSRGTARMTLLISVCLTSPAKICSYVHRVSVKLLHVSMMGLVFSKRNSCHQFGYMSDTTFSSFLYENTKPIFSQPIVDWVFR